MRTIKKIMLSTAIAVFGFILFLLVQIINLSRPTKGQTITQYNNPKQAVLVIDIQEDFTGTTARPPFPYRDSDKLISTVNKITESASHKNVLIVYIKQELSGFSGRLLSNLVGGGVAIKGNPGTEVDKRVAIFSDTIFPKPRSDAFSNPKLEEYLIENQVNELILVGLDADGCIHATARGALNRGYKVNIIKDAIVLMNEEKWEELLEEYRQEGIQLMLSQEFLIGQAPDCERNQVADVAYSFITGPDHSFIHNNQARRD